MTEELKLEQFLPYRLAILSHTVSTTIAHVYDKRFGLSIPEWRVIAILGRFPGLSAVEVAERTLMDKVAVSRAVTKLIKNGRIDRQFADADRRRSILNAGFTMRSRRLLCSLSGTCWRASTQRSAHSLMHSSISCWIAPARSTCPDQLSAGTPISVRTCSNSGNMSNSIAFFRNATPDEPPEPGLWPMMRSTVFI